MNSATKPIFLKNIKKDFPFFKQNKNIIYLDNAATTQKPQALLNSLTDFYSKSNSNSHRGSSSLSNSTTTLFEDSRLSIAKFIGANPNELVFTKSATESLNLIANGLAKYLKPDDEILLPITEHHSSYLPIKNLAKKTKAKLVYLPLKKDLSLDLDKIKKYFTPKTKILCLAHVSNVLGTKTPIKTLCTLARKNNSITVIDGTQAISKLDINVKSLGCDFYVFSAHKILGPTGLGILYGKYSILESIDPLLLGGSMVDEVTKDSVSYLKPPHKFEAGTQNIAGVIGFSSVIDYINSIGKANIFEYERSLSDYCYEELSKIKNLTLYSPNNSLGIFSFNIKGIHAHDVSSILDKNNIITRSGKLCTHLTLKELNSSALVRVSLLFYNTKEEIDKLTNILNNIDKELTKGNFL